MSLTSITQAAANVTNFSQVVQMDPASATYEKIAAVVGNSIGQEVFVELGMTKLTVVRKCTYKGGGMIKTNFVHIMRVKDWGGQVIEHWREQKDGSFKTI